MSAGRYDFLIEEGATFTRTITWQDSAGAGITLTGKTVAAKLRAKTSDNKEIVSFTCTVANQGTYPGRFTLSLTATQTAALPTAFARSANKEILELAYDIEITSGSEVYRLLEGIASISPEVTR